jgi:hypothetical protein
MAWGQTLKTFGVCGNFRFAVHTLTDIKATRSLIRPMNMVRTFFVASTNETDNADILNAQTLSWTGTCDTNVANEIKDTSEVFDPELSGCQASNTADTVGVANPTLMARVDYNDADELYCSSGYAVDQTGGADFGQKAFDLCPDGNETYTIYSERVIQVTAVSANDDGTILVLGA